MILLLLSATSSVGTSSSTEADGEPRSTQASFASQPPEAEVCLLQNQKSLQRTDATLAAGTSNSNSHHKLGVVAQKRKTTKHTSSRRKVKKDAVARAEEATFVSKLAAHAQLLRDWLKKNGELKAEVKNDVDDFIESQKASSDF